MTLEPKAETESGLKVVDSAQSIRVGTVKEACAPVVDDGVPRIDAYEGALGRVVFDHAAEVQHEMSLRIETQTEKLPAKVHYSGPELGEDSDPPEPLAAAKAGQRRSLAKIPR